MELCAAAVTATGVTGTGIAACFGEPVAAAMGENGVPNAEGSVSVDGCVCTDKF